MNIAPASFMEQLTHHGSIVRMLDEVLDGQEDRLTLGEVVQILGTRSYGPALLFVALVSMTPPISVTPGLPIVTGTVLFVLSVQLLFLRSTPWLPGRVRRYAFSRQRLSRTVARARPWVDRLDRWVAPRWQFLLLPPFVNLIGLNCAFLALLSILLAPLPGGENVPAAAILIFGLALTARDGLVALAGLGVTFVSIALLVYFWTDINSALLETGQWFAHSVLRIDVQNVWVLGGLLLVLVIGSAVRLLAMLHTPASQLPLDSLATWWILFLLLAMVVALGSLAAALLLGTAALLGVNELRRLTWERLGASCWWLAFAAVPIQYAIAFQGWLIPFWTFIPIGAFLLVLITLAIRAETGRFVESAAGVLIGMMLPGFLLSHAVLVLSLRGGTSLFLYLIVVTATNDIAQALWGRCLGRRPIAARVSPHKTWEGFLLGGATAVGVALVLAGVLTPFTDHSLAIGGFSVDVPYLPAFVIAVTLVIGGFFGDLTMSALKRQAGVKDSGAALPGQGGVLDRIDSLIFTAPLFFYFVFAFFR